MRSIRTPLLVLEPLTAAHAREMFSVLSDPAIYEFENRPPESESSLAERYSVLEARRSRDGQEVWLNWVIRLPSGELTGYVQATVLPSGLAYIAYELGSRHWRRGIGSAAVAAMLGELSERYEVVSYVALPKKTNFRSLAFLRKLGFDDGGQEQASKLGAEADEVAMTRSRYQQKPNQSLQPTAPSRRG